MRPKLNFFVLNKKCHIWKRENTAFQHKKKLSPSVKHGDGSIMVWAYFAGELTSIVGMLDFEL